MSNRRLLLDTHVFLWWLMESPKLGVRSRHLIQNPENDVYVSSASTLEVAIKKQLGKLDAPDHMAEIIETEGFLPLFITTFHAELSGQLPLIHKDPFDRLLIAQSQLEGLELLSVDSIFSRYHVSLINASE
ncbi:type II toxin-antitoxin system VapC family toxin [Endozoicomonas arenosclerae]|uniref:type II toxin-antitoxin system VapC family toxin n=1 Tax=Endozoicomonas arenosclerae TaxID=1633495 RepID=UPI000782467A|nr:type II toxin-antitoxin system VapC family toxin [Endozoicomonas arenosclerae]